MKKLLRGKDYERIEEEANDLIEDLGLRLFPVNCFEVAFLLGIAIKTYAEFNAEDAAFIVSKCEDGFTIRKGEKYIIYYNDAIDRNRIKFTIWHEIAHIQLGHLERDCNLAYEWQEEEANHFAAYVMAPLVFVHRLGLSDPIMIADVCEISLECACHVYEHYVKAFQYENVRNAILNGRIARLLTYIPKEASA